MERRLIFEVRAEAKGRVHSFGARPTRAEAEQLLEESEARVAKVGGTNDRTGSRKSTSRDCSTFRAAPHHASGTALGSNRTSPEDKWTTLRVEVLDGDRVIATYNRNYAMLQTFEPFRQGERDFALVSPDYTTTAVLDLSNGEIVAGEEPNPGGFCPVGFYVPDWWDLHQGSILPGSMHWSDDHEWPTGDLGFVWGCVWGDDSSWKVQYLDLSGVQNGVLHRDDRFGYVKLAAHPKLEPHEFIRCWRYEGELRVGFWVEQTYDLLSGRRVDDE